METLSQPDSSTSNWQLLGETELLLGDVPNQAIRKWLCLVLAPLALHEDIVHKAEKSLQDAAGRAFQTDGNSQVKHIHLRIHVPSKRVSKGQTWGFFRVDKIEEQNGDGALPDYAVELYLYLDPHR